MAFNPGDTIYYLDELANGDTFIAPMTYVAPVGKEGAIVMPAYQYAGAFNMAEVLEHLERTTRTGQTSAYRIVMNRRCFVTKEQAEVSANAMLLHMATDIHPTAVISPVQKDDTIFYFDEDTSYILNAQVLTVSVGDQDVLIEASSGADGQLLFYGAEYGKRFFCSRHAAILALDSSLVKSAS